MTQQIYMPTRIIFGENSLSYLENIMLKYENIFIILTGSLKKEYIEQIKNMLAGSIQAFGIGEITSEPNIEQINHLMKRKTFNTDCIIGIGGGSYLDSAKALAIQERRLEDFDETTSKVLPIITIPTTAGTGAELTKSAIIKQGNIKRGVRSEKLFPQLAIVDPILSDNLPLNLTLYTAFDAFTHAVETYVSKKSSGYTRLVSEKTVRDVLKYLPQAVREFKEIGKPCLDTRIRLSYAAMLQGINLTNSSSCLPHRIQYAISAVSNASHAMTLASIYRSWLNISRPTIAGYDYKQLIEFMDSLQINIKLSDIGVQEKDLEIILKNIEGALDNDPYFESLKQIRKILEESL